MGEAGTERIVNDDGTFESWTAEDVGGTQEMCDLEIMYRGNALQKLRPRERMFRLGLRSAVPTLSLHS